MDNSKTINRIWEILTTLTDPSQNAALAKAQELKFDTNRGVVSLEESFINLNLIRDILKDLIEKNKLIQLPITIQKTMLTYLESISKQQNALIGGADEVVNLATSIEQLYTFTWQYRLNNLSEEVLGYESKLNQLKNWELEASKLKKELAAGIKIKNKLEELVSNAEKGVVAINDKVNQIGELEKKANDGLKITTEAGQKATGHLSIVQQNEAATTQQLASAKASTAETAAFEKKIKEFYAQIDESRNKTNTIMQDSQNTVQENNKQAELLISKLKELEGQIKVQIEKATGFSLFHSFQTRQERLASGKRFWAVALALLVAASISLTIYIFNTTNNIDAAFFMKLSISLPLIYAIAFCNVQYSRERKLEEEYAFKSNISISLIPYQELVEKLTAKDAKDERDRYATFMIESISKVFTSPTEKIFDHGEKPSNINNKTLKQLFELLAPLVKALKQ